MIKHLTYTVGIAAILLTHGGLEVFAQETAGLDEIIVTAQKRSESIQDVPLAVSALSAKSLENAGVNGLEALQSAVPNLNVGQQLGVARIALRGVGLDNLSTGAESSIAFHLDGVFVSRSAAALSAFYDVDRVEVLRGPQGTLYGRNATGGSVNIFSARPTDELEGYGSIMLGNYNRVSLEGAVSGPISDNLQGRLAFSTNDRDGYGKNTVSGNDIDDAQARSIRGSLAFLPNDDMQILLVADYHEENDSSNGYHYLGAAGQTAAGDAITPYALLFGGVVADDVRDISSDLDPENDRTLWGLSGEVTYDFGNLNFKSLTSFRNTEYSTRSDLDMTSFQLAPIYQDENAEQFSQEIQLTGASDRLDWLVGAYYFHESVDGDIAIPYNDIAVNGPGILRQGYRAGGTLTTDVGAVFGQLSYSLTDELGLTVGARYSTEKKKVDDYLQFDLARPYNPSNPPAPLGTCAPGSASNPPLCDPEKTYNAFTPKVAVSYKVSDDSMIYGSISKGFKSGTYNLGSSFQSPVDPEKVWAYEGGFKSELFDHRLRANLAGFYYDYEGLQVGKVVNASLVLENAATATIKGLELELLAKLSSNFELGFNGAYLDATFDNFISADPARPRGDGVTFDNGTAAFNNAGNRLPQAPEWTANIFGEYSLPIEIGTFTARAEINWVDEVFFSAFNIPEVKQSEKTKINLSLRYVTDDGDWEASIFGRNLGNKTYVSNSFVTSSIVGFGVVGFLDEPLTYGVKLKRNF